MFLFILLPFFKFLLSVRDKNDTTLTPFGTCCITGMSFGLPTVLVFVHKGGANLFLFCWTLPYLPTGCVVKELDQTFNAYLVLVYGVSDACEPGNVVIRKVTMFVTPGWMY